MMLRSCKYCGRIHDTRTVCPRKPVYKKGSDTDASKFRSQRRWKNKSIEIRKRDKGLCVFCIKDKRYIFDVSVHHIVPLEEDINKGLININLITVCREHHDQCEDGRISRVDQHRIAMEQEVNNTI